MTDASLPSVTHEPTRIKRLRFGGASYARARLCLGITGVGVWVIICVSALATEAVGIARTCLPAGFFGDAALLAGYLGLYLLVQLPLDWLGGYVLPRKHERLSMGKLVYLAGWARGVLMHAILLAISTAALYAGALWAGAIGAGLSGLAWLVVLAAARDGIARAVARLDDVKASPEAGCVTSVPTVRVQSDDEGFTGGVVGLLWPRRNQVPASWVGKLTPSQHELACRRRDAAICSGAWRAGRLAALGFVATGLWLSVWLAELGPTDTGVGIVETSLWFSLWAFVGLLTLPSLSRRAALRVDYRLQQEGVDPEDLRKLALTLDRLQDDEPERHPWIERVFHTIPSAATRRPQAGQVGEAFWDVGRTSVYLGISSISLLSRAVHCNVGRPALWVWLPTD